jgi:hypothetical protein
MKQLLLQTVFAALSIACMAQVSGSIEIPTVCSPSDILVAKVNLDKGNVSGVGKLELQIPSGLQFTEAVINAGATVRHSAGVVKFLWTELPVEQQLEATFKFRAISTKSGMQTIKGTFSYRNEDETQVVQLPVSSIDIIVADTKEVVAKREEPVTTESAETTSSVSAKSEEVQHEKSESAPPTKAVVKKDESIKGAQIDKGYDKALFHVQLASSKIALTAEDLEKRFPTSRKIIMISYEGGYKYAVERLKTYEAAKKLCAEVKGSGEFTECFVTSSFEGSHISLQEAIKMNR